MYRKLMAVTLILLLFCGTFAGCSQKSGRAVSCDEVIKAYEDAGYEVLHNSAEDGDYDWQCYVRATDAETGDYIFLYFFETPEQAESYGDTRQYHVLLWVFSVIYGDPSWLTTKVYQNIEIEYDRAELYKPFQKLISG